MLSICIPSYNRKDELHSLINSLLKILVEFDRTAYEIIVVENGIKTLNEFIISNNTEILKYKCNDINLGFSNNVKEVIKLATKKYIWLLSDNDILDSQNLKLFLKDLFDFKFNTDIINIPFSESKNGIANTVVNMDNPLNHLNKGELPFMLMSSIIFKNRNKLNNQYLDTIPENIYLQNIILYKNVGINPSSISYDKVLLHYTFEKNGRFYIVKGHNDFCEIITFFKREGLNTLSLSKKMNYHYCQMLIFEHFAGKRTLINIDEVVSFFKIYRYIYPIDIKYSIRTFISCLILFTPYKFIKIFSILLVKTSQLYNKLK